jgi:hypothetical protein
VAGKEPRAPPAAARTPKAAPRAPTAAGGGGSLENPAKLARKIFAQTQKSLPPAVAALELYSRARIEAEHAHLLAHLLTSAQSLALLERDRLEHPDKHVYVLQATLVLQELLRLHSRACPAAGAVAREGRVRGRAAARVRARARAADDFVRRDELCDRAASTEVLGDPAGENKGRFGQFEPRSHVRPCAGRGG